MQRAARRAEQFVARNGYTDLPPAADTVSWAAELFELPWGSLAELMRQRRNTLERRAVAVCPHGPGGRPGYTVVFRYKAESLSGQARAVRMGPQFDGMVMQHQEFSLRYAAAPGSPCTPLQPVGK